MQEVTVACFKLKFYTKIQRLFSWADECTLELVSKELNHLAAILHVYAGGLNFIK